MAGTLGEPGSPRAEAKRRRDRAGEAEAGASSTSVRRARTGICAGRRAAGRRLGNCQAQVKGVVRGSGLAQAAAAEVVSAPALAQERARALDLAPGEAKAAQGTRARAAALSPVWPTVGSPK